MIREPAALAEPAGTTPADGVPDPCPIEDVLVEEVSIDGMCGVY